MILRAEILLVKKKLRPNLQSGRPCSSEEEVQPECCSLAISIPACVRLGPSLR